MAHQSPHTNTLIKTLSVADIARSIVGYKSFRAVDTASIENTDTDRVLPTTSDNDNDSAATNSCVTRVTVDVTNTANAASSRSATKATCDNLLVPVVKQRFKPFLKPHHLSFRS